MTLDVQFETMLVMTVMGIWLGAAMDTYHRFLGSPRQFRWTHLVNDLFFWCAQGLILFYTLLKVNEGEMRFYVLLALLLGYSAYRALFQKAWRQLLEWIIGTVIGMYRLTVKMIRIFVVTPVKWLLQVVLALCMIIISTIWRIVCFLLKVLTLPVRWLLKKAGVRFTFLGRWKVSILSWTEKLMSRLKRLTDWFKKRKR
ncbi:spore cortex biosynthesis protein YabQ [Alteribacter natronophilus]|uniref:spore cortex biosynthesis protein YabQ n=1 Tax=Alteribacter natronophilus TaxID=2583810 RepID=UPI00110DB239|nr:spore cortex biosynthesis protein YabQ [Alteribacter natronophilus]TMW69949.1 spore cortex biosynthesis protein YabQ [Alteribacter natronophilus]